MYAKAYKNQYNNRVCKDKTKTIEAYIRGIYEESRGSINGYPKNKARKRQFEFVKLNQVLKMLGHILGPIKEKHRKFIKKNGVLLASPLLGCVLVL